jgi:phage-related minor tail protein
MPPTIQQTAILNLEVDQSAANKQLVQTEKNILSLKKQQAELNKEYKEGKITQDQYVKANIQLQRARL